MKRLISIIALLAIVFVAAPVWAADLQWDDPGAEWDEIVGYRVYYSGGGNDYHETLAKDEVVRVEGTVTYENADVKLDFPYNVELTIHITAYNVADESGPSNIVTYTREGYVPPPSVRPAPAVGFPSSPSGLRL